ncbi:MAG: hypothetical protein RL654_3254, partial [Pseudomonadota bacterium]
MNSDQAWWLLVLSLPTAGATARMRLWRALKALGCAALRDGVYLLPSRPEHHDALQALADECLREGGSAWLLATTPDPDPTTDARTFPALFDRREDYASLRKTWAEAVPALATLGVAELTRLHKKLRREFEALRAIDFFPNDAGLEADAAWRDLSARIERLRSPDEPQEADGTVPRLDAALYQGRLWATRRNLWVDRVASAWLIRRFIDRSARFQWLAQPADCPPDALGFDFDGAAFSHVGDRVTFETLLESFGLTGDAALTRLGALVHGLDVGGPLAPEASGFEAVLAGAR